jgi:hypothetical protein
MLLPEIARVLGVARVLCAIRYEPTQRQRDEAMCRVLSDAGFEGAEPVQHPRARIAGLWSSHRAVRFLQW